MEQGTTVEIKGIKCVIDDNIGEVKYRFEEKILVEIYDDYELDREEIDTILNELGISEYEDGYNVYLYNREAYKLEDIEKSGGKTRIFFEGHIVDEVYEYYRDCIETIAQDDYTKLEESGKIKTIEKNWNDRLNKAVQEKIEEIAKTELKEGYIPNDDDKEEEYCKLIGEDEYFELSSYYEDKLFNNIIDSVISREIDSYIRYTDIENIKYDVINKDSSENFIEDKIEFSLEEIIEEIVWNKYKY